MTALNILAVTLAVEAIVFTVHSYIQLKRLHEAGPAVHS